jgi:hypothetical protein
MLPGVERLSHFARALRPAALALLFCAAAAHAARAQTMPDPQQPEPPMRRGPLPPIRRNPLPQIGGDAPPSTDRAPTMKRPAEVEVPASRARRSYDAKRDATYVNVDVTLLALRSVKDPKGAARLEGRGVTLTFQLIYRGAQTYDLLSAYLILESTAAPGEADRLAAVTRLVINADPYEYDYERASYQTETVATVGAAAQQLRKEVAAFRLPTEDLPQLAGAGRLLVKFGAESFPVKSPQLSELRRTLAAGADK